MRSRARARRLNAKRYDKNATMTAIDADLEIALVDLVRCHAQGPARRRV
jgi:hypothetical protein